MRHVELSVPLDFQNRYTKYTFGYCRSKLESNGWVGGCVLGCSIKELQGTTREIVLFEESMIKVLANTNI